MKFNCLARSAARDLNSSLHVCSQTLFAKISHCDDAFLGGFYVTAPRTGLAQTCKRTETLQKPP